jgi:hypothetical protein
MTQGLKTCNQRGKTEYINLKLLPTPTAMPPRDIDMKKRDARMEKLKAKGLSPVSDTLSILARKGLLPTPQAVDGNKTTKASKQDNLNKTFQAGGASQLNPLFVAEMMGFPEGWLVLPFQSGEAKQSKPAETQ